MLKKNCKLFDFVKVDSAMQEQPTELLYKKGVPKNLAKF